MGWVTREPGLKSSKFNILFIIFNQVGKGTYWRAFYLARALVRNGHKVSLMAVSQTGRLRLQQRMVDGVQLIETPDLLPGTLRSGWDIWNILSRILWVGQKKFDIVHGFETRPVVIFPSLIAKRRGAVLFLDWCDWFGKGGSVEERTNPLVRAILRPIETFFENNFRVRADGTTAINNFLKKRAIGLGVRPESILLLRNGSNTSLPLIDSLEARRLVQLSEEGPFIGFVGRAYMRDAVFMAKAFEKVRQAIATTKLLLVGYFNRDIEVLVRDPSAIIRTGTVKSKQLYLYLSACDLCWLPLTDSGANRGRWPIKINDYIAVGRPIIATDVGDLQEFITENQLGLVASPEPSSFADQTVTLLQDPELRNALGMNARQAATTTFSWNRLVDELEIFYTQVLVNRHNETAPLPDL